MLKQRLIAALVLIPLVILAVLAMTPAAFAVFAAAIVIIGVWEWSRLIPLPPVPLQIGYVVVGLGLLYALWQSHAHEIWLMPILLATLGWWLLVLVWLRFPAWGQGRVLIKGLVAVPVLVPAWLALTALKAAPEHGGYWVLYVMTAISLADSAAYFTGRAIGRHKLAPAISPGKTWEGVAGGVAAGAVLALVVGLFQDWRPVQQGQFIVLTLVTIALSIVGDLLVSLLKRQAGIKDTSHLIPGHGGLLDRIDSLLAGSPIFVLGAFRLGLV